jgi:hypothetical protein
MPFSKTTGTKPVTYLKRGGSPGRGARADWPGSGHGGSKNITESWDTNDRQVFLLWCSRTIIHHYELSEESIVPSLRRQTYNKESQWR